MYAVFMKIYTRPGKKQKLLDLFKWDAEVAEASEPGTLRFDFYEDPSDDSAIYLYEAYTDEAGFEEHKKGEPFQAFIGGISEECIASSDRLMDWKTWNTSIWLPSK